MPFGPRDAVVAVVARIGAGATLDQPLVHRVPCHLLAVARGDQARDDRVAVRPDVADRERARLLALLEGRNRERRVRLVELGLAVTALAALVAAGVARAVPAELVPVGRERDLLIGLAQLHAVHLDLVGELGLVERELRLREAEGLGELGVLRLQRVGLDLELGAGELCVAVAARLRDLLVEQARDFLGRVGGLRELELRGARRRCRTAPSTCRPGGARRWPR
jgi:hypothetical protein